jgi:nucleotide-binding universal stress UspA family protein
MYNRILVPVDGSTTSSKGLAEAIELAHGSRARLMLVHVVDELILDSGGYDLTPVYSRIIESLREAGRRVLASAESAARQREIPVESRLVETFGGRAADQIVDAARQWNADLIVMGTHGRRGLRRLALGSDAELVLRTSPVPVLLVRDAPES